MSGTKAGGLHAANTNKTLHGADYYKRLGAKGGNAPHKTPRGFAGMKAKGQLDKISAAGKRGGAISRRWKGRLV